MQSSAAEGQHLATVEVRPYVTAASRPGLGSGKEAKSDTNTTTPKTSTTPTTPGSGAGGAASDDHQAFSDDPLSQIFDRFGLCMDEGALWVEWVVPPQHLQAALSFGVLSHAAAVDPDARYHTHSHALSHALAHPSSHPITPSHTLSSPHTHSHALLTIHPLTPLIPFHIIHPSHTPLTYPLTPHRYTPLISSPLTSHPYHITTHAACSRIRMYGATSPRGRCPTDSSWTTAHPW